MTAASGEARPPRVAYVMSRFPKVSETFVLYEALALEEEGVHVELYPLLREPTAGVVHREALPLVERAHYLPFLSREILASQLHFLRHRPGAYLRALGAVVRGTWGSANFLVGGLAIFPKVAHAARRMAADGVGHVHCHFANHPALAGFVVHRLVGIPYSFTAHGSDLHVDRHMLCRKVEEAAFVVTVSEFNRRVVLDECGGRFAQKVTVVHCGVDTRVFSPRPDPGPRPFTVTCVGTLHEVKGQRHLVEACRLLVGEGVDVRCLLVGDGPDRARLERQAGDLAGRVRFAGSCTRDEVAALLREAHVLAAPSVPTGAGKREGIPVVLMEAMATALPVVASRLSGIPELVEDGRSGLLVEPGDARGLADALRRLHDDPALRARLGAAGRARVEQDFDVRRTAGRLARAFLASARP